MSIKPTLTEFLNLLGVGDSILPSCHVIKNRDFDPSKDSVYYSGPFWDEAEPLAALKSILTGKWLSAGEEVRKFEQKFSRKFLLGNSLMVNSGSSANLVMVAALKKYFSWQDGDEIIQSVVGFPTTLAPVIQNGLCPVFVDIEMNQLNFDLEKIEQKITAKTKGIICSPVLGNPPDMDALASLCLKHDIVLIMDNCDSLGSKWKDRFLTDYAFCSSTSFYAAHHICTGEGGMVSSKDADFVAVARSMAWWGRDCNCVGTQNLLAKGRCGKRFGRWLEEYDGVIDHKYLFRNIGYNLKPLDLQGAIGTAQLEKVDLAHERRRIHKTVIGKAFEEIPGVIVPNELSSAETGWFGVPIICENQDLKQQLVQYLEQNRIQTRNYFAGNILLHPAYRECGDYRDYPNANKVLAQVFFVGCHPGYSDAILGYVVDRVKSFNKLLVAA